jgi:DNA polymerase-3 subunit chi
MVSRADFYQLKSNDPASRYPLLCRLLEKCLAIGQQVYIICGDEAEAGYLNQYIWGFKPDSFIPHIRAHEDGESAVVLGHPSTPDSDLPYHREICINLGPQLAPEAFERVIELVVQEAGMLQTARSHYASYSQLGRTMRYHSLPQQPQ